VITLLFLLAIALTSPQPTQVDRIEVNTSPNFRQVILYRWTRLACGHGYRVADWWIVDETYQPAGRLIARYEAGRVQEFTSQTIETTETKADPEMQDRSKLPQDLRRSYLIK